MNSEWSSGFRVLDAGSPNNLLEWEALWNSFASFHAFAHPFYLRLFCEEADSVLAFVWQTNKTKILFPLIRRNISDTVWHDGKNDFDLVSPYGYGGAFYESADHGTKELFGKELIQWCRNNGVVSLFSRLTLFEDESVFPLGKVRTAWMNVVRDLSPTPNELWMSCEHKVRKNVNRARSTGLRFEADPTAAHLPEFLAIYKSTMDRNHAGKGYYFEESFFQCLLKDLPGCVSLFHIFKEDKVISTELVLLSGGRAYSFLGGTLSEYFSLRPNDLLKYEIMLWAKRQGMTHFVLGGGQASDDGIFRYKKSFAPKGILPFRVGSMIVDDMRYGELVNFRREWEKEQRREWSPAKDFFPAYRS